jgi:hypothetical protein
VALTGQAQDVFLYWWTSAFTQVLHGDAAQGSSASLFADFGSTYELTGVQLFDGQGSALSDWTMTDLDTNALVFDASGRLAPIADAPPPPGGSVPEPASATLFLTALGALGWSRRRRGG